MEPEELLAKITALLTNATQSANPAPTAPAVPPQTTASATVTMADMEKMLTSLSDKILSTQQQQQQQQEWQAALTKLPPEFSTLLSQENWLGEKPIDQLSAKPHAERMEALTKALTNYQTASTKTNAQHPRTNPIVPTQASGQVDFDKSFEELHQKWVSPAAHTVEFFALLDANLASISPQ